MESIFNSKSWDIKYTSLDSKELNVTNKEESKLSIDNINLKYVKPIFFDSAVRIDIELTGEMNIQINDYQHNLNSQKKNNHCIMIKNWSIECGDIKSNINQRDLHELKLSFNSNTEIKKFTITQNLKIDGCNPNN